MKNGKVLNNPVQVWKPELAPALGILSIHTSPFRCTSHQFATEFPFSVFMNLIFSFDGDTVDEGNPTPLHHLKHGINHLSGVGVHSGFF